MLSIILILQYLYDFSPCVGAGNPTATVKPEMLNGNEGTIG